MTSCHICTDSDRDRWQEFVESKAGSGLYHDFRWKEIVERAYGHTCFYLMATDGSEVSGVLPLVLVRSRIFGVSLTSLPYVDFAGVVANDSRSRERLVDAAISLASDANAGLLELRHLDPVPGDFVTSTHKVLMTMQLEASEDLMWKRLSSERRNRIRKADQNELRVVSAGPTALPIFYDVWTQNMRDLGSPPHSRDFFSRILESFGDRAALLLVLHRETPVGAALALRFGSTLSVPWVSSLRQHFRLYPNNILYWSALRHAIDSGCTVFDFGRSTMGSGTFEFKQRWGATATPLHWQFHSPGAMNKNGPGAEAERFGLAMRVWQRLPVALTRWIGPSLRRSITA